MKKFLIILISILIVILILSAHSHLTIDITEYNVKNSKIPKEFNGFKILHLSDLHNRNIEDKILEIINKERIDVIFMSGDMINDHSKNVYSNFISLCKKIKIPSYYIYGNHEYELSPSKLNELQDELKDTNLKFLNNEKIKINKYKSYINLLGLSYPLEYYSISKNKKDFNKKYITDIFGDLNKNEYNILLTHNPLFAEVYDEYFSDLVFSGHVHGGVIKIPFIGGLLSPDFTFFPDYYEGMYQLKNTKMIVSRGIGYGSIKIRILNPAEIIIVTLNKE